MMAEYRFEDIAINSTKKKKPVEEDKYHYLGLEHLDSGTFTVSRFGSEVAPIGEKLLMKKGDVLFGKRRAYQKKVAIAPFDGIFSAHGMVLRPKENVVDKDFFPLFIASDYFLDAAINISVGSLSPTINWRDLKELKFTLPPLAEQKKLAEVLWAIVATMESYKKLLVKTDELVRSNFQQLFSDITCKNDKFPIKRLGDIAFITKLAGFEYTKYIKYQEQGDIIMIRGLNCKKRKLILNDVYWIDKQTSNLLPRSKLYKGDLVLTYVGTVGEVALIDRDDAYHLAPNVAKISLNDKDVCIPEFFAYIFFFYKDYIISHSTTTTQSALSMEKIRDIEFAVPPVNLQKEFLTVANKAEESKSATQASLDSLTKLYKKIIADNLGGNE